MKRKKVRFLLMIVLAVLISGCQQAIEEVTEVTDPIQKPNVAVLVGEGFHDGEAYMPIGYLLNQGMNITIIGPAPGTVKAYNSDFTISIEKAVSDVSVNDFDALVLPGGRAPASLREIPEVVEFAREFFDTGKPVAAICHGPQVLATAGVLNGKTSTGVSGIRDEIEEAGATFVDEALVIDGNLITSRTPPDLAVFSHAIGEAVHESFVPLTPGRIPQQPEL